MPWTCTWPTCIPDYTRYQKWRCRRTGLHTMANRKVHDRAFKNGVFSDRFFDQPCLLFGPSNFGHLAMVGWSPMNYLMFGDTKIREFEPKKSGFFVNSSTWFLLYHHSITYFCCYIYVRFTNWWVVIWTYVMNHWKRNGLLKLVGFTISTQ